LRSLVERAAPQLDVALRARRVGNARAAEDDDRVADSVRGEQGFRLQVIEL